MITESSILNTRYRLEKKIGQGGFAQVFLATDQLLKRRVAVKVLNHDLTEEEDFLTRFEHEAQAIAGLEHPNILGVYDYGQAEGTAYLVMPFIEGGTLQHKLRNQPERRLELPQTARYLQQAAAALDYAHRRNIVHRDIKPQNMMLRTEEDRLLLGDFGIAKVITATSAQSRTGVMGTLSYMAPEQLEGQVGFSTDIYALGCVLFQMLSGQLPYIGSTEQVMMAHLLKPVPLLRDCVPVTLPEAVQSVVNKALAKRPEERFQSAGEMAHAFEAAINPASNYYFGGMATTNLNPSGPTNFSQRPTVGDVTQVYTPTHKTSYNRPPEATIATGGPTAYANGPAQTGYQTPPSAYQTGYPTQPPTYTGQPTYVPAAPAPLPRKKANVALLAAGGGVIALLVIGLIVFLVLSANDSKKTTLGSVATSTLFVNTTPAATTAGQNNPTITNSSASLPPTTARATTPAATTAAPNTPEAELKDAYDTFFAAGDLTNGIAKLRALTQKYPNNAKVWRDYGNALHLWNRDAGGIEPLQKATELDSKDARAFLYLMFALLDNYRYDEAKKAADTAAQLDPNGWVGQAAQASYNNFIFKTEESRPKIEKLSKNSTNTDPYFNWVLSFNLAFLEDYKGAITAIDKTLSVWPNMPTVLALKGSYLLSTNLRSEQDKALKLLQQAQSLNPQSSVIQSQLGEYYAYYAKDYLNAEKYAQAALKINNSDATAHAVLAEVYTDKKDFSATYREFDRCIQIDEYHLNCYFGWAQALIEQGNSFNKAGKKTEATTAWKAALEKAQKANGLVPQNANSSWLVGYAYYSLSDFKNAISFYQKAIAGLPNEPSFYGWLGLAYFDSGQRDKAQAEYNKGVAIDPENEVIKYLGERLGSK